VNPQPDLWSQPRSRRTDPETSKAAEEKTERTAPRQRQMIVNALRAHGPTDQCICEACLAVETLAARFDQERGQ